MEPRTNQYIAQACQGELVQGQPQDEVVRLSTDSRSVTRDDLFFAIPGERFDGHDFIGQVAEKGAAAIVAQHGRVHPGSIRTALVLVDDTRRALGRLGARYRQDFRPRMFAVGGSNGKTSTKQLLAAVLGMRFRTLASEGSFNNDIGVPTTLLGLTREHEVAVLEAGTNHPGELAPLVEMIAPEFGIITSIGREHLEFFGDVEQVAREEGALAELLPAGGKLFLTADSEWSSEIARRSPVPVVTVGTGEGANWRGKAFRVSREGTSFRVEAPSPEWAGDYRVPLLGRHQGLNAIFAIAAGAELGMTREQIQAGLEQCRPAKMRLQLWDLGGVQVLDDAYNANADSMRAALRTLRDLACRGRRIAVLGDMAELGSHSEAAHEEVGRAAAEHGVEQLFAIGHMAPVLARGARAGGLNRVMEFGDVTSAAPAVKSFIRSGDLLLLKASRSAKLERLTEMLKPVELGRRTE